MSLDARKAGLNGQAVPARLPVQASPPRAKTPSCWLSAAHLLGVAFSFRRRGGYPLLSVPGSTVAALRRSRVRVPLGPLQGLVAQLVERRIDRRARSPQRPVRADRCQWAAESMDLCHGVIWNAPWIGGQLPSGRRGCVLSWSRNQSRPLREDRVWGWLAPKTRSWAAMTRSCNVIASSSRPAEELT